MGHCPTPPVFSAFHGIASVLGVTCPPFSVFVFFKSATACLFPPSSSFLGHLKPCSATFAGSFLWQVSPLTNLLVFSLDGTGGPLWGWLRPGGEVAGGNERPVSSQAPASSLCCPLKPFCPPPHPPEHSRAGVSPGTPRAGAAYVPGRGLPLCRYQ